MGYVSRDFLAATLNGFHAAGHAMEVIVIAALLVYAAYRATQFHRHKKYRIMPRVQAEELAARLASSEKDRVLIVDVRSPATTTLEPNASPAPSTLNPTISMRRSRDFPKTRTFTSTVLERAKRLAPGWRIYCRKEDSTRL